MNKRLFASHNEYHNEYHVGNCWPLIALVQVAAVSNVDLAIVSLPSTMSKREPRASNGARQADALAEYESRTSTMLY